MSLVRLTLKHKALPSTWIAQWEAKILERREPLDSIFFTSLISNMRTFILPIHQSEVKLLDVLVETGLVPSRKEAKTAVSGNAVTLNLMKCTNLGKVIEDSDFFEDKFLMVGLGKGVFALVLTLEAFSG